MEPESQESRFAVALTQASLGRVPPELCVATGHDEHVMLFLLRVGDAKATSEALMDIITMAETALIMETFDATGGLIRKRFSVDDAYRLKNRLETFGTVVEFVRPDDVENDAG